MMPTVLDVYSLVISVIVRLYFAVHLRAHRQEEAPYLSAVGPPPTLALGDP